MSWSERALSYVKKLSTVINHNHYLPFIIDGNKCGLIHRQYVQHFREKPELFDVSDESVQFSRASSKDCRSDTFNCFLVNLCDEETVSVLKGKAVSKKPDMSADTPVRGQGCLQTGVSADRGVCGQVFRIDKQFPNLTR